MAGKKNRKQKLAARGKKNKITSPSESNDLAVASILNQALIHHKNNNLTEAEKLYHSILELQPTHADALHLLGLTYGQRGCHDQAISYYDQAIKQNPVFPGAYNNKGISLNSLGKYRQAAECIERSLEINPEDADAHSNLGHALSKLGDHRKAVAHLMRAVQLNPEHVNAYYNLGNAMKMANRESDAIRNYNKTLELVPNHVSALNNLGIIYRSRKQYPDAIRCFQNALNINPGHSNSLSQLAISLRYICDWDHFEQTRSALTQWQSSGHEAPNPFSFLMWSDDPQAQQLCARAYTKASIKTVSQPINGSPSATDTRIKVAYLSTDFREHPVAHLTAELYELHDRDQFEITAIAYGESDSSPMRKRLIDAFDHFHEAGELSDTAVAELIASKGIHIVIDLGGHTQGARLAVLARRPAPIQINYLGYIGTMGAGFIDYAMVDQFSVPVKQQQFYDEQLIHLPCYMVTDAHREITAERITRAECGLPEDGFVFCSFNNTYKITPDIFDIWMRCLANVPDSVLWLLGDNEWAQLNLCNEAKKRNVDPARLIFAPRVTSACHLARQRLADLFLDTSPVNAGATASDALWMGLPVLSCAGKSFISRMGCSLVHAAGLPELVTESLDAYEALAIKLAQNPETLVKLRSKLLVNRKTAPLFNSHEFCKQFEAALTGVWNRWKQSLPPEHH